MNAGDWISAALAIVQIAAIIVGAAWAYWKFVKGRIFHRRAEPAVEGTLLTTGSSRAVRAKVAVENTGPADIPLRVALLTVSAYGAGEVDEHGHPVWRDVARAHAFRSDEGDPDHLEIESQETITDDVVIPIPAAASGTNVVAYRISCHVYERRKEGGGICWTTKAVVPAQPAVATALTREAVERAEEREWVIGVVKQGEVGDSEPVEPVGDVGAEGGRAAGGSSGFGIGTQDAGSIANVGGDPQIPPDLAPSAQQRPAEESEIEAAERDG